MMISGTKSALNLQEVKLSPSVLYCSDVILKAQYPIKVHLDPVTHFKLKKTYMFLVRWF